MAEVLYIRDASGNFVSVTALKGDKGEPGIGYEVGDVHISANPTSPAARFGGSWEAFGQGRVLVGAGTLDGVTYTAGQTGGEQIVALTVNQMPAHKHDDITIAGYRLTVWSDSNLAPVFDMSKVWDGSGKASNNILSTGYTGGGEAHNNMQPYVVVYMWKRVA